jgi:hypothetical protein
VTFLLHSVGNWRREARRWRGTGEATSAWIQASVGLQERARALLLNNSGNKWLGCRPGV